MMQDERLLVVSAHAADFVWRAGGTIAKYVKNGAQVHLVVLSVGVRGESNDLWKAPDQTAEHVKDMEDYPLRFSEKQEEDMVRRIREIRPTAIITHDRRDVLNPDHNAVHEFVFRCSVESNSAGVITPGLKATSQMQLYGFEPHQTELSGYVPGIFVDITESYPQKVEAMECFKAQGHLIEYYKQRAFMRGNHARRLSGRKDCQYAESFARVFPQVASGLA